MGNNKKLIRAYEQETIDTLVEFDEHAVMLKRIDMSPTVPVHVAPGNDA